MRNALAQSINIPAIKTLYLAGMKDTLRLAKDMGIESLTNTQQYGLTLVLGGGEVSLLELTSAYGVFANDGMRNPHRAILEVKDRGGRTIEKASENATQVLDAQVAQQISDILSDEELRAPAFGYNSPLNFPGRDVAVKTGTTNDYRDAIISGYTPDIAIAAWAGNNSNAVMERKVAAFIIAPYWNKVMNFALKKVPDTKFLRPPADFSYELKPVLRGKWQGGISNLTSRSTRLASSDDNSNDNSRTERLSGGVHTILHWVSKDDPRGPVPSRPQSDSQYEAWEYGVRNWVRANGFDSYDNTSGSDEDDEDVGDGVNSPTVSITTPTSRTYDRDATINIQFRASGPYTFTKADYYINDMYIGSSLAPFGFTFKPQDIASTQTGQNMLQVIVYDAVLGKAEDVVRFNVRD